MAYSAYSSFKSRKKMPAKAAVDNFAHNLDYIFSCSVCGDTFSEVYKGPNSTVQGLSDGRSPPDRIVTRLYVGGCAHVVCVKHLGNGNGPEFHREGLQPQSPCPVCIAEGAENTLQDLYSLRGFSPDEHDIAIPRIWFVTPPNIINGLDSEMGAVRFQYLALARYAKLSSKARKETRQEVAKMVAEREEERKSYMTDIAGLQQQVNQSQSRIDALEEECQALRDHVAPLEKDSRTLAKFRTTTEPAIKHYLGLVEKLAKENDAREMQLRRLGFGMSTEPIPNSPYAFPLDNDGNWIDAEEANCTAKNRISSRVAGQSAATDREDYNCSNFYGQHPHKRQRSESPVLSRKKKDAPSSRDMMPPPKLTSNMTSPSMPESRIMSSPHPVSRMKSIRKLTSTLRKKFSKDVDSHNPRSSIDMYNNRYLEEKPENSSRHDKQLVSRRCGQAESSSHMPDALPPSERSSPSKLGRLIGIGGDKRLSGFTFRSQTPARMNDAPARSMPDEPSYMRLMDGLVNDKGLDFRIQDPRQKTFDDLRFPHTSSNSVCKPQMNHALYASNFNPITPMPVRNNQPADEPNDIVSPFFGANHRRTPTNSRVNNAERHHRPTHSTIYQSRGGQSPVHRADWREPPSLNGLSFFNEPLNERHELIDWRRGSGSFGCEANPPKPSYRADNLDSGGFIKRPETYCLQQPYHHNRTPSQSFIRTPQQSNFARLPLNSANRSSTRVPISCIDLGLSPVKSSSNSFSHFQRTVPSSSMAFPSPNRRYSIRQ